MSLGDHLRELRRRVVISLVAIFVLSAVGWAEYDRIFSLITEPVRVMAEQRGAGAITTISFAGITDPFSTHITVALFVGMILASPVWLYETWAFIVPGLTGREKRTAIAFLAAAVPLFLAGCACAYWALPRAVDALLGFTPSDASNVLPATDYLSFILKFILAFGIAFLLPVFLVGLNAAGVLPARVMLKGWRPAVFLIFVFAAVMTPTPDAYTMILLALPMVGLFFLAVGIGFQLDKRRERRRAAQSAEWLDVPDDEASKL